MPSREKLWTSFLTLFFPLAGCATDNSKEGRQEQAPSLFDASGLLQDSKLEILFAMDALEDRNDPAAAPYLLGIMRDKHRSLELRARAAAVLMAMGFPQGQAFCLAVLRASLKGMEAETKRHAIPRLERYAFARELALRQVRKRLQKQGKKAPFYDVNQGVKDMLASCTNIERELQALQSLRPGISNAALARKIPLKTPSGFEAFDWPALRKSCLAACAQ